MIEGSVPFIQLMAAINFTVSASPSVKNFILSSTESFKLDFESRIKKEADTIKIYKGRNFNLNNLKIPDSQITDIYLNKIKELLNSYILKGENILKKIISNDSVESRLEALFLIASIYCGFSLLLLGLRKFVFPIYGQIELILLILLIPLFISSVIILSIPKLFPKRYLVFPFLLACIMVYAFVISLSHETIGGFYNWRYYFDIIIIFASIYPFILLYLFIGIHSLVNYLKFNVHYFLFKFKIKRVNRSISDFITQVLE